MAAATPVGRSFFPHDGGRRRTGRSGELSEETGVLVTPATLRWGGRATFALLNPPRCERAAVYLADLDERPDISPSDELVDVRWFPLEAVPEPHAPLDLAIARVVSGSILREGRGEQSAPSRPFAPPPALP